MKRAANSHGAKENEVYLAIEVDLARSARGVERCAKFYVAIVPCANSVAGLHFVVVLSFCITVL